MCQCKIGLCVMIIMLIGNLILYRYVEAVPSWAKNLEWEAPPGITQVSFIARSPISNDTATCHFKIHVVGMCIQFKGISFTGMSEQFYATYVYYSKII